MGSMMQDDYYRSGHGFLLVYSITSTNSFEELKETYLRLSMAREAVDANAPLIVLAGNKCDLDDSRQVPTSDGEKLAQEWGCPFYETSAKEKVNNVVIYEDLVRQIRKAEAAAAAQETDSKPDEGGCCLIL